MQFNIGSNGLAKRLASSSRLLYAGWIDSAKQQEPATPEPKHGSAAEIMRRINSVWLNGNVESLAPMVHPDIVMALPGFTGRILGREAFLAGFRDFCRNARIHEFWDYDYQVDVAGDTSVITFRYDMIYERSGEKSRASGRDLWIFENQENAWIAVWRTLLEMDEKPV